MSKIGLLAFTAAAIAVAGVSYAADKITLSCSGTTTFYPVLNKRPSGVGSILIDLDNGIVLTNPGNHSVPIIKITEESIMFGGPPDGGSGEGGWLVSGSIDRISGVVSMSVSGNRGPMWGEDLVCKPAKPLF